MGKIRGLHSSNGKIPDRWLQELIDVINTQDKETIATVNNSITKLIGSAPETLDTLEELADAIKNNEGFIETLNRLIQDKADKTDVGNLSDLTTLEQESIVDAINELDSPMELIKTIKIEEDDVQYIDVLTADEGIHLDEFICVVSGIFSVAGRSVVAIRSNDGGNYWLHMAVTYSDSDITNSQYKTVYSYNRKISNSGFLSLRSASAVDGVRVGPDGNLVAQGIAVSTSTVNGSLVSASSNSLSHLKKGVNNLQVFTTSDSVSTFAAGTIVWLYGKKVRVTE